MKGTGLWIHQESVIIAAEFHEPWELTPEFLVEKCNVPSTWLCRHSDRSSDQTDIRYGPCHWTMDYDRLRVTEYPDELLLPDAGVTPGDSEEFGSNVSILAHNFLNAVPTLPFRGLWFFWRISAINKEREQWMRDSFSPSGWPRDMIVASVQPRLTVVVEDGVFDVSVRNEARQRRGRTYRIPRPLTATFRAEKTFRLPPH